RVPTEKATEDDLMETALDAGADDIVTVEENFEVYSPFAEFEKVRSAIETKGFPIESAEMTQIPQNTIQLEGKKAEQMVRLMGLLDEQDDIQNVYANFDIDDELLEKLSEE
ncbi:MAG: YebC/PmpR family DNA-binding transcriptional regulator, partial [candidate division Zixibacteria bacterium]|nr:YebC/PmpR family DNA-binding transcriptional regulator [candidate division Zixibacteria bacterium]